MSKISILLHCIARTNLIIGNFFQSLTNHITRNQNTIGGDFNMVTEFRDRTGGTICNTHLLGSIPLNELLKNQNLQDTWRKIHPNKINYTYHRTLSNINSRFIPLKILI